MSLLTNFTGVFFAVIFVHFLVVIASLIVSTSAVICL